mgnify:CR=1 FL=1
MMVVKENQMAADYYAGNLGLELDLDVDVDVTDVDNVDDDFINGLKRSNDNLRLLECPDGGRSGEEYYLGT